MERTKSVDETGPKAIRYTKLGGGSLRLVIGGKKRIIKPGETFTALPNEIPFGFKDTVVPLDPMQLRESPKPTPVKVTFKVEPRGKSKSQFDVVDGLGKRINDTPLTKEVAIQLVNDLAK